MMSITVPIKELLILSSANLPLLSNHLKLVISLFQLVIRYHRRAHEYHNPVPNSEQVLPFSLGLETRLAAPAPPSPHYRNALQVIVPLPLDVRFLTIPIIFKFVGLPGRKSTFDSNQCDDTKTSRDTEAYGKEVCGNNVS
jgi:hypothetical protein